MATKIKANKTLFVTIEGEPSASSFNGRYAHRSASLTELSYAKMIDLSIDTAILEQGWKKTELPIYLFIRAWFKTPSAPTLKKYQKFGLPCPTKSRIDALTNTIIDAIVGKVISRAGLVAALDVKKVYGAKEPRLEIFIGVPSDWEELENDLSYAEEKSAELEELEE